MTQSGADVSVAALAALPHDRARLTVISACVVRTAHFLDYVPASYDAAATRSVVAGLAGAICGSDPDLRGLTLEHPPPQPDEDQWAWEPTIPIALAGLHLDLVEYALDFLRGRQAEQCAYALDAAVETMEDWSERDLNRRGVPFDRENPSAWTARKYTFVPVWAEMAAQRIDLALAGRDEPGAAQEVLERAQVQGEWLVGFWDSWIASG